MLRIPRFLVALLACIAPADLSSAQAVPGPTQGPAGIARPGAPPGSPIPGMPTRDPRAPQSGTARLSGRIVAAQVGTPLRRAQVTLVSVGTGTPTRRIATSDGDGRFEFTELPAGRFTVSATKAGYVSLEYGQKRPFESGTPINIADGERVEKIDFSLARGSVIAVRVTDDFNEPLAGAQVQVQRFQYGPDGQRRLTGVNSAGLFPFAGTDDRGEMRVYGLMPGEYVLSASVQRAGVPAGGGANDVNEGFS